MRALLQRVTSARVDVAGECVGEIAQGLLVFLAVQAHDGQVEADKLLKKILAYRIFSDDNNKMNLNVQEVNGELLIVSQFTLAANTDKGLRPGFSKAAPPAMAEALYDYFVKQAVMAHARIQTGIFAADMQVSLCNDGPVTFLLDV